MSVASEWGGIDVYFFDQVLRGRLTPDVPFLDAGCGRGRNLIPLLARGFDGHGSDRDAQALVDTRIRAEERGVHIDPIRLKACPVERLDFDSDRFGFVLSNAVLHFAATEMQFEAMLDEMWRVLRPGGVLFARLASTIGIESLVEPEDDRWHRLPDGSRRFLVDLDYLKTQTARVGGRLIDPIKTVNVENQRCMTNWCVQK